MNKAMLSLGAIIVVISLILGALRHWLGYFPSIEKWTFYGIIGAVFVIGLVIAIVAIGIEAKPAEAKK